LSETDKKPDMADALSSHLLGGKKHHDENKNVETEEFNIWKKVLIILQPYYFSKV